jgi:hypothetical protein
MNKVEEQQYMDSSYPPSSGMMHMDSKADLLDKIKPELAVEVIKQVLMGKEWDAIKEAWVVKPGLSEFALTEFGATIVASLVYPACSQNTSLSNLKEDRIYKRLLSIIKTLCKDMLDYHQEMGIKSSAHLYHIKDIVYTIVQVSLTQSESEGIRRLINSTIQESRNVSTYGEEKGGIMGLFRRK